MLKDYESDSASDSVLNPTMELFVFTSPVKLHMSNSDVRMRYFTNNWPVKEHATSCEMVEAGLYYLDDSDRVTVAPYNSKQP